MIFSARHRTAHSSSSLSSSTIGRCFLVISFAATVVVMRLRLTLPVSVFFPATTTTSSSPYEFTQVTRATATGTTTTPLSSHRGFQLQQQQQPQPPFAPNPHALSCATVEHNALSGEWYDPLRGQANLIRRVLDYPYYYISLHSRHYDVVRHKSLYVRGRYYERTVTQRFHAILGQAPQPQPNADPSTSAGIVLDVGANVGVYTLLSAGLGHVVHAFEINPANLIRLCESLWINGFVVDNNNNSKNAPQQQVQIYQRGMGAQTGLPLRLVVPHNPGQAHLVPLRKDGTTTKTTTINTNTDASVVSVETLTLDDWAEAQGWFHPPALNSTTTTTSTTTTPNILLLKMDVEGVEPSVVAGAQRLLRTGWIKNVLTEVKEMSRPELQTMLRTLLDCGYVLMLDDDDNNDNNNNNRISTRRLTRSESERYLQQLQKKNRATWYRKDVTVDLWFQLVSQDDEPSE